MFNELEGTKRESVIPDAEEGTCVWSDIWNPAVMHKENRLVEEGGKWTGRAGGTRWHPY